MTLIVNLLTRDASLQISDRRLSTRDGKAFWDHHNKAICVVASDGQFSVAYTGLAVLVGNVRTDNWLADRICDVGPIPFTVRDIISTITTRLSQLFSTSMRAYANHGLTVVCSGFESGRPFFTIISNVQTLTGVRLGDPHTFVEQTHRPPGSGANVTSVRFGVFGAESIRTPRAKQFYRRYKRFLAPQSVAELDRIEQLLVEFVRGGNSNPNYGHAIGKDCIATAIVMHERVFRCVAYRSDSGTEHYAPSIITDLFSFRDSTWKAQGDNVEFLSKMMLRQKARPDGANIVGILKQGSMGNVIQIANEVFLCMPSHSAVTP